MLSYRHAFHAGNHADVLKHLVLVHCLAHLNRKESPYWVIDTHAGAGVYALESGTAGKLDEWRDGIGRLWDDAELPPALREYRALVQRLNTAGPLRHYPGSPWLAWTLSREGDRLRFFERHPADHTVLAGNLDGAGKRVKVSDGDGFAGLKALLPPPPRRGLVLLDPSYETRSDYEDVPQALADGLKRFPTGIFLVWYPRLSRREAKALPDLLERAAGASWLDVTLDVTRPASDGHGMFGSGMFIANPPWTLAAALREGLPWLADRLGQDGRGRYTLTAAEP